MHATNFVSDMQITTESKKAVWFSHRDCSSVFLHQSMKTTPSQSPLTWTNLNRVRQSEETMQNGRKPFISAAPSVGLVRKFSHFKHTVFSLIVYFHWRIVCHPIINGNYTNKYEYWLITSKYRIMYLLCVKHFAILYLNTKFIWNNEAHSLKTVYIR